MNQGARTGAPSRGLSPPRIAVTAATACTILEPGLLTAHPLG
jgi:hypothetical protein